jgi:hypothetical protein
MVATGVSPVPARGFTSPPPFSFSDERMLAECLPEGTCSEIPLEKGEFIDFLVTSHGNPPIFLDCHSERREESCISRSLRSFTSFRMTGKQVLEQFLVNVALPGMSFP